MKYAWIGGINSGAAIATLTNIVLRVVRRIINITIIIIL